MTDVEVCQLENFAPTCTGDAVVVILNADYGRRVSHLFRQRQQPDLDRGWSGSGASRCIDKAYDSTDCLTDVTSIVAGRCSGRRQCRIKIPDEALERSDHGCPRDLKATLAVRYGCLPGEY